MQSVSVRKAAAKDVPSIFALIENNTFKSDGSGFLLPESKETIAELVSRGDFFVAEANGIIGCASLVEYGIAELRSLVVAAEHRSAGIGRALVEKCKAGARKKGYDRLYALVNPEAKGIFSSFGFVADDKPPEKMLRDCINCPLYHNSACREQAVVSTLE